MDHAELVPNSDLEKPCERVFYMPMHAVVKASSTTTKVRAVFDASAKSASGVSLNDQLLVGPTVHAALVDVLLRFRLHRIALATDVSRMYRAILLPDSECDLHRFVWRRNPTDPLKDFRMTRLTFGVSASSFAGNMAVKQNAIDFAEEFPLAASAVHASFYVDDGLVGADSAEEATRLQQQLQELALLSRRLPTPQVEVERAGRAPRITPSSFGRESQSSTSRPRRILQSSWRRVEHRPTLLSVDCCPSLSEGSAQQTRPHFRRRQNIRRSRMVCACDYHPQDSLPTSVGGQTRMGRPSSSGSSGAVGKVEKGALGARQPSHSPLLLPQASECHVNSTPRIQRCV